MNFNNLKLKKGIFMKGAIKEICNKITFKKGKKKKGFTLLEVIAVIAIIGILSAAIVPNVTGYIKEAKKVKVVDQCRKVVMAAESYKLKYSTLLDTTTISEMKTKDGVSKYLEQVNLGNLPTGATLGKCYDVVNGGEFELEGSDMLKIATTVAPTT